MRIEIKTRNTEVSDAVRAHAERHLSKVAKQVPELARLELELSEERNPAIRANQLAEFTLQLKGTVLRAHSASPDMIQSVDEAAEKLARQVKRYRDKRRGWRRLRRRRAEPATR